MRALFASSSIPIGLGAALAALRPLATLRAAIVFLIELAAAEEFRR
jgi:hypothetical protein